MADLALRLIPFDCRQVAGVTVSATAPTSAGQVFRASSTSAGTWSAATYPNTATAGDLMYGSASNAWSSLAKGTARQLLQMNAGATAPEWASNIDIPGTLDVTGAAVFDSTLSAGRSTISGKLTVTATADEELLVVNGVAGAIVDLQTWRVNGTVVATLTATGAIELTAVSFLASLGGGDGTIGEASGGSMTFTAGVGSNGNQVFNAKAAGQHHFQYGGTTKQFFDSSGLKFDNAQTVYFENSTGTAREVLKGTTDNYTAIASLGSGIKFYSVGFGAELGVLSNAGAMQFNGTVQATGFHVASLQVVGARKTGWGAAPSDGARSALTSGSSQTAHNEALRALIADLHATAGHGLIAT